MVKTKKVAPVRNASQRVAGGPKKSAAKKKKPVASPKKKVVKKAARVILTKKKVAKSKTIASLKRFRGAKLSKPVSSRILKEKKEPMIKRITYMALAIVLGLLIAVIADAFLEMVYLKNSLKMNIFPSAHGFLGFSFYLSLQAELTILLAGLCFGVWVGTWGWQTVYVERKHRIFRKKLA